MKRALLILLACVSVASAQTFLTVTADTNRVVRTNFSLVRSQISDLSGASFAISNITGLQTALDGKLATNGTLAISNITSLQSSLDGKLATNGSAAALTNFPALLLQTNSADASFPLFLLRTNGSASALTNFPASVLLTNSSESVFPAALLRTNSSLSAFPLGLLRTNGDGSALTNLPNANLSNAIGVLPLSNGGTGSTNASNARTALELGTAATNPASAFQPASSALTNLAAGDASGLTNLPNADLGTATGVLGIANGGSAATNAEGARTNFELVWSGLTNTDAAGFRTALSLGTAATNDATAFQPASTNLDTLANNNGGALTNVSVDLTTVLPAYSNNAGKVLAVASGETNVEWTAISNTVTDASLLTNFPSIILQTNSADGSFPAFLLRTNGNASGLTFPSSLLTTNGNGAGLTNLTAASIVGTVALASNVSGTVAVANGGTGASDVTNARINLLPSYTGNENRILALNSNATDIIWTTNTGGGAGTVTSVGMTVPAFLSVSGSPITNSGTLAVSYSGTALPVANGGTGITNAGNQLQINLGLTSLTQFWTKLGANANASGNSSVSIGYNSDATTTATTAIGTSAQATGIYSLAVGSSANATNREAIALGRDAWATATNAVQIGDGTNSTTSTIQFFSAGTVNATEWGYLANASTAGGSRMTNTNGVTATNTIIGYDGTNYTTNTITVIDGIITGWTQ